MTVCGTGFEIVDIAAVWPTVAERALRSRLVQRDLAAIRHHCKVGDALCLAGPDGIVILGAKGRGDGHLTLTVLLAVSGAPLHGAFERSERAMLAIARDLGADTLLFESQRKGWGRLLGDSWSRHDGTYRRSV